MPLVFTTGRREQALNVAEIALREMREQGAANINGHEPEGRHDLNAADPNAVRDAIEIKSGVFYS